MSELSGLLADLPPASLLGYQRYFHIQFSFDFSQEKLNEWRNKARFHYARCGVIL